MDDSNPNQVRTASPSFESLKKINRHGIEYWSARDLQTCLGYSEWRKFETTMKKAIDSCKQSGNDPENHFVGADKMVADRKPSREKSCRIGISLALPATSSPKMEILENPKLLRLKNTLPFKLEDKNFLMKWLLISND